MAKIRLKDTTFSMQDGTAGTAAVNNVGGYVTNDTTMLIDTVVMTKFGTPANTSVPVGARFTVAGETGTPVHVVTSKVEAADVTSSITFTPGLAGAVADNAVITFTGIRLDFKIGEGNVTWTEVTNYEVELERGDLETGTISSGDDEAMQVSTAFTWESYTTGTGETTSPVDAVKGIGGASEWVTAGADDCEPYAVELIALHKPPACLNKQQEQYVFPEFRVTNINPDFEAATMSITGICKAVEPTVTRI